MDINSVDVSDPEQLKAAVAREVWFHSIDLGNGVIVMGQKSPELLQWELERLRFPDLTGKSVLDIGTYDGFYAFEAERRGAARVVGMDIHVWQIDTTLSDEYLAECAATGTVPTPTYPTECLKFRYDAEGLPGKRRFDLAHRAIGSRVEPVVQDFMAANPGVVGRFDVVLFLGVLYHTQNPLAAVQRVASLTKEVAIIETEAMEVPGAADVALCEFFSANELNGDYSNWWSPNIRALRGLLEAAGFKRIEVLQGPPDMTAAQAGDPPVRYRAIVHAFK